MSAFLGLRLLASGALRRAEIEAAFIAHARDGLPFVRALLEAEAITPEALEHELSRSDLPVLRTVMPVAVLASALPRGLCQRLLAVPVRQDPYTGTVDVAVVDPFEPHVAEELSYHLGMGVRVVRAPFRAMEEALLALERDESMGQADGAPSGGPRSMAEPPRSEAALRASPEEDAPVSDGPFAPNAPRPPFADIEPFIDRIRRARDRDSVLEGLLGGMRTIAHRVGVFVVKRGEHAGWVCTPELGEIDAFRALRLPAAPASVLTRAASSGSYFGPVSPTEDNEALLAFLKEATNDVSIASIVVGNRPVLLLYADELGDSMLATRRAMRLAEVAGQSLAKLLRGS